MHAHDYSYKLQSRSMVACVHSYTAWLYTCGQESEPFSALYELPDVDLHLFRLLACGKHSMQYVSQYRVTQEK